MEESGTDMIPLLSMVAGNAALGTAGANNLTWRKSLEREG